MIDDIDAELWREMCNAYAHGWVADARGMQTPSQRVTFDITNGTIIYVPQRIADAHALAAQQYAGWFYGHPVQTDQYPEAIAGSVHVDESKPWREPNEVSDDCLFCERLTDEEAERRVLAFQAAIDKECVNRFYTHYHKWRSVNNLSDSAPTRRRYVEEFVDAPPTEVSDYRALDERGWLMKPLPMHELPLRLKRKLCIAWNHIYLDWMASYDPPLLYDFDSGQFYCVEP